MHVDFRRWELNLLQSLFHFLRPLLHECVKLGHGLRVVYSWWWSGLVQVLHGGDPPSDLLWLFISVLDRVDVHWRASHDVLRLNILEFQNSFVLAVKCGFIEHGNTQVLVSTIWLWHLQERVNLTHGWHEVGYERLDLGVEVNLLWLKARDVLEEFFNFTRNRQVSILQWVVCTVDELVIVIIIVVILVLLLLLLQLLLRFLALGLLLRCLLLVLSGWLHVLWNVNLIIFLIVGFDLLRVVHIDGKIVRLIINLGAFQVQSWLGALVASIRFFI